MIYPYNDADLKYDYENHRYIPTLDFIKRKTGIDLKNGEILNDVDDSDPSTLGERVLDDLSDHLYRTIYMYASKNRYYVEFLLATDEECRIRLKRAFINELKFVLRNGDFWFSLSEYDRVNKISDDTYNLMNETLPNGVKLLYQGQYQTPLIKWREGY
jgi:hypothetical protein